MGTDQFTRRAQPPLPRPPRSRWLRAVFVAGLIAMWPVLSTLSCGTSKPSGTAAKLDFTLKDMNGADVKLASFKGRPIVLNFWATWCGPCKAEVPMFVELAETYKAQNLAFIGVSTDDDPKDIRAFATDYKVNYPLLVGLDHDDLMQAYEATVTIPVTWFIRKDGTLSAKAEGIHPKGWFEAQIKALF